MNNQNPFVFDPEASFDVDSTKEPVASPAEAPKAHSKKTLADLLFAWGSFLLFWFLMQMRSFSAHPLGVFLALLALSAAGALYLRASHVRQSKQSVLLGALLGILALSIVTNGNPVIRGLVIAFLLLSFPFRIFNAAGLAENGLLSDRLFANVLHSFEYLPFRHVKSFFSSLFVWKGSASQKTGRVILWTLIGIFAALIPTLIIVALLSYDKLFTDLLERIFSFEKVNLRSVFSPILAIPLAAVFFGMFYAAKRYAKGEDALRRQNSRTDLLPCALLCGAATPILAVYVIFFISQMPYYLSAFTGVLPEGITYADYAKEGFFQLCAVSAINALLLIAFSVLMQRGGHTRDVLKKLYASLISVMTLVLIATALSKMALYISTYGLTQKRVYASWLMILMAICFIAVLIRQAVEKFPLVTVLAVTVLILVLLIVLINADALIASYNVNAYLSGTLPEADVQMMQEELGISSLPSLVRLRDALAAIQSPTQEQSFLLQTTEEAIRTLEESLPESSLFSFSIPNFRARNALK